MSDRSEFISFLEQRVHAYTEQLEAMLGKCDARFVFRSIERSTLPGGGPQTPYPGDPGPNGCLDIDIQISKDAWDKCHCFCGAWEVAHECVHLLDPTKKGAANFLEEGLGAWFQDQPEIHVDSMKEYVMCAARDRDAADNYTKAKDLVSRCKPKDQLIPAVKKIRLSGVRISDITPDMLTPRLSNVDPQTIACLCKKFPT